MISVLLSDLRPKVREQLGAALSESSMFSAVRTVTGHRHLLAVHRTHPADLVLLGRHVPPPDDMVRRLKEIGPHIPVVVVISSAQEAEAAIKSLQVGASGILRWDGQDVSSDRRRSLELVPGELHAPPVSRPNLTGRERQVLEGISAGRSNSELATSMHLTEDTVKSHARTLYRKLGARDRAQAVMIGLRLELID